MGFPRMGKLGWLFLTIPKGKLVPRPWTIYNGAQWENTRHYSTLDERREKIMAKGLPKKKTLKGVKHVILVASGKGGVGKSTTAVNLATALAQNRSLNIGLLDADVFGPSIPLMMNVNEEPLLTSENLMIPLVNYNVKCMSMGFLVKEGAAVMWRGLMVMQAIQKLLFEVDWDPTDILVVDTPPGTGDTHLSLIQHLHISGALVVTTPQKMALEVAGRGISMFRRLDVPIIGIVQNMGSVVCSSCHHNNRLFGPSIEEFASKSDINVVQDIPFNVNISTSSDEGKPLVLNHQSDPAAASYLDLASKVARFLNIEEERSNIK